MENLVYLPVLPPPAGREILGSPESVHVVVPLELHAFALHGRALGEDQAGKVLLLLAVVAPDRAASARTTGGR